MHFHHLWLPVGFQQTVQRTCFSPPPLHLYQLRKILLWSLMSSQKTWKPGQQSPMVCWEPGWWQHWGAPLCHPGGHPGHPSPELIRSLLLTRGAWPWHGYASPFIAFP